MLDLGNKSVKEREEKGGLKKLDRVDLQSYNLLEVCYYYGQILHFTS